MRMTTAGLAICLLLATDAAAQSAPTSKPLEIRTLNGSVVRVGSLHGAPLYGVRLRALVCAESAGALDRSFPMSFRIAHYVNPGTTASNWGAPFRAVDNDLYWVVPLGEDAAGACRSVGFEDVIPPDNYGGVESALGAMGYSKARRCYGVQLTVRAALDSAGGKTSRPVFASKRAVIQCGKFRPR